MTVRATIPGTPRQRATAVRMLQAALVLGAAFQGLGWSDAAEAVATTGRDALALHVQAPVVAERGPWHPGDVLTESDAGVDVNVAPVWTVWAAHEARGVAVEPGAWTAALTIEKIAGDGRTWWSVVEEVPLDVDAAGASVVLDAYGLVTRAQRLDETSKTPGRLDVTLAVSHAAAIVVAGERVDAVRTSRLQITPSGTIASLGVVTDSADWSTVAPRAFPTVAVALAAVALALEPVARRLGRAVPAWERARGVNVVEVENAPVPDDVPRCDLPTALAMAKKTGSVVFVDRARGIAVVQGAVALVAPLPIDPPGGPIVVRDPAPVPRAGPDLPVPDAMSDVPTRPMTPLSEVFGDLRAVAEDGDPSGAVALPAPFLELDAPERPRRDGTVRGPRGRR